MKTAIPIIALSFLLLDHSFAQELFVPAPENTAGVGIALGVEGKTLYVAKVMPESPAAASKQIREKDRILAVGQGEEPAQPLEGKAVADCVALIRGAAGSKVRLTVLPEGAPEKLARVVILTRDDLQNPLGLAPDATLLEVGSKAPELKYVKLDSGQAESLAEAHAGKIVVLKFWATWCTPCHEALTELQSTAAKYASHKDKISFLTICIDGEMGQLPAAQLLEKAAAFAKEKKWTHTVNGWSSIEDRRNWHVGAVPLTYIIGADGKILLSDPSDLLDKVLKPLLKE